MTLASACFQALACGENSHQLYPKQFHLSPSPTHKLSGLTRTVSGSLQSTGEVGGASLNI